ncbi:MAG: hypothetical protein H6836_05270 [Planctomycetes bacterium]|nr:hypothetical protein [Planctomycetota bacterium]
MSAVSPATVLCTTACALLCATGSAQYAVTPAGLEHVQGNANSSLPFQGVSSRYQQVHDAADIRALNGRRPFLASGLHLRPASTYQIPARVWDVELTLGATSKTAATMSTSFAANFTATPTTVLPMQSVSLPAGVGVGGNPNPPLWIIPFKQVFSYSTAGGGLCWEWRHKNGKDNSLAPMDAVTFVFAGAPSVLPQFGAGCTANGRTRPARSDAVIAAGQLTAGLVDGPSSAAVVAVLGLSRADLAVAGWCEKVYPTPSITLAGATDPAGRFALGSVPVANLQIAPYFEVYIQYGFADPTLPNGIGLSSLGTVATPPNGGSLVSRLYSVGTTNGNENATSGFLSRYQGLVTMLKIF